MVEKNIVKRIKEGLINNPVLIILIGLIVFSAIASPSFITWANIRLILLQGVSLIIASIGLLFVVLNGSIDFSITSVMCLGSVVGAAIMTSKEQYGLMIGSPFAVPVAIIAILLIGLGIGLINGISVVLFKMPSFITTLATSLIFAGIATLYTGGQSIPALPESFTGIASGSLLGIPIPFFIAIAVIAITYYILAKTVLGRRIYAVGTNNKTAKISGIPTKKTVLSVFIISGLLAAVACIISTARLKSGSPSLAGDWFIDLIASVIIGGTNMFGGEGKLSGTVLGALLISTLNNSLNMFGVQWYVIDIVKGAIIIAPIVLTILKKRSSGKVKLSSSQI